MRVLAGMRHWTRLCRRLLSGCVFLAKEATMSRRTSLRAVGAVWPGVEPAGRQSVLTVRRLSLTLIYVATLSIGAPFTQICAAQTAGPAPVVNTPAPQQPPPAPAPPTATSAPSGPTIL